MIDYQKRAEHLLAKIDRWAAQVAWERHNRLELVDWKRAFEATLANPDGDSGDNERRDLLARATYLLAQAQTLLAPSASAMARLQLRAHIEQFSRLLMKEAA